MGLYHDAFVVLHLIGAALGVGGATVSDSLFIKSVKDGLIDKKEFGFLKVASRVVWTGLALAIFTGVGFIVMYQLDPSLGQVTEKVLAKTTVVFIILVNGIVMHWKIFPLLKHHAETGTPLTAPSFRPKIPMALTIGVISITSWYSAIIIGAWRELRASFLMIYGVYVAVVLTAIVIAQIVGHYFMKRFEYKEKA